MTRLSRRALLVGGVVTLSAFSGCSEAEDIINQGPDWPAWTEWIAVPDSEQLLISHIAPEHLTTQPRGSLRLFGFASLDPTVALFDRWSSIPTDDIEHVIAQWGASSAVALVGDVSPSDVRSEADERGSTESIEADYEAYALYRTGLSERDAVIALGEDAVVLGESESAVRRTLDAKLGDGERYHEANERFRAVLARTVTPYTELWPDRSERPSYRPPVRGSPITMIRTATSPATFDAVAGSVRRFHYFRGFDERFQGSDDEKRQRTDQGLERRSRAPVTNDDPVLDGPVGMMTAATDTRLRLAENGDWHLDARLLPRSEHRNTKIPRMAGMAELLDGRLLVNTMQRLHVVDPASAEYAWSSRPTQFPMEIQQAENGQLLVVDAKGEFTILAENGNELAQGLDTNTLSPERIADDTVYGFGNSDDLLAMPLRGGEPRWALESDYQQDVLAATPETVVVHEGGNILEDGGQIHLLDARSGEIEREINRSRSGNWYPLRTDTHVLLSNGIDGFWGVPLSADGEDTYFQLAGDVPDTISIPDSVRESLQRPPIRSHVRGQRRFQAYHDGRLYAATGNVWEGDCHFEILALEADSSGGIEPRQEFHYEISHPLPTRPAVTTDHVYVQNGSELYAVSRESEERVWSAEVPEIRDLLATDDDRLVLLTETGVYSLTEPTDELPLPFEQLTDSDA